MYATKESYYIIATNVEDMSFRRYFPTTHTDAHPLQTPTVYIATVHWNSDTWVEQQISRLQAYIKFDFQIFAFMDGVSEALATRVDHAFYNDGLRHHEKLDFLAEKISQVAGDNDLILFIDGDAFPISDLTPIFGYLDQYPLVAVRRDENFGDKQPHPCFCLTSVDFWRSISGTWKPGVQWMRDDGNMGSDVGGNLYGALRDADISWKPLLRSNPVDLHSLFFGVYDNAVYHHGAGFRDKFCRHDKRLGINPYSARCIQFADYLRNKPNLALLHAWVTKHVKWYMRRKNSRLHKKIMGNILADEDFVFSLNFAKSRQ